jgi:hypothetical protein
VSKKNSRPPKLPELLGSKNGGGGESEDGNRKPDAGKNVSGNENLFEVEGDGGSEVAVLFPVSSLSSSARSSKESFSPISASIFPVL